MSQAVSQKDKKYCSAFVIRFLLYTSGKLLLFFKNYFEHKFLVVVEMPFNRPSTVLLFDFQALLEYTDFDCSQRKLPTENDTLCVANVMFQADIIGNLSFTEFCKSIIFQYAK